MKYPVLALLFLALLLIGSAALMTAPPGTVPGVSDKGIRAFASEQEFSSYLQESAALSGAYYSSFGSLSLTNGVQRALSQEAVSAPTGDTSGTIGGEPSRVSETNVQVFGIDEPDIVKTDGKHIYFSSTGYYGGMTPPMGIVSDEMIPYRGETKVLNGFPPEDMDVASKIDKTGNMLLYGNSLVIFSGYRIFGYDVSDPDSPEESWQIELNGSVAGARLYNGKIYLITRDSIDTYRPCPIVPLTKNGVSVVVECSRIYYPVNPIQADVTFNAMVLEPASGEVEKAVSFVGSASSTIVYMSTNAIYVTYTYSGDIIEIFSNFFKENTDLIPANVIERLDKLSGYDISTQSKMIELQIILQEYRNSLSRDDRLKLDNELGNRMGNYTIKHKRDFIKTGIAKIGLDLNVMGSGSVPGTLLNQFSLDEYENHLRVAVTIGGGFWGMGWSSSAESANDVYVLDGNMNIVGSVKDLGLTERIYSVRFLQDKGYLVTFRQVDPFYVLDLSSPTNPELKGELKIPGYSSYLHPITKDKILGVGKEGSQVKISLFDVSSPADPKEKSKYTLSEYWSDVLNTHHAFLLDDKHKIFFMPGSNGGYVFSYENDELTLVKAVSGISAKRAIYIDDYLYIIGDNKIAVLDENTWEKIKELDLSAS